MPQLNEFSWFFSSKSILMVLIMMILFINSYSFFYSFNKNLINSTKFEFSLFIL